MANGWHARCILACMRGPQPARMSMNASESAIAAPVIVHVIEDDESSRIASSRVLKRASYAVRVYADGAEFLANPPTEAGCVVLDLRLPGASGLELQEQLTASENPLPIVFLTGQGDIPQSVRAMKAGA